MGYFKKSSILVSALAFLLTASISDAGGVKDAVDQAKNSNMRHRPIGLGVQGLADTFIKLRLI